MLEIVRKGDLIDGLVFTTYFQDTKIFNLTDSLCTIVVNSYIQVQVLKEYLEYLSGILAEIINIPITCQVVLESDVANLSRPNESKSPDHSHPFAPSGLYINPDYSFDNFIVGESNAEPHAAALATATNPGKFYNPLFIYGDSGLGKTHLLQAIANYIISKNPGLSVLVLTGEDFVDGVFKYKDSLDYYKNALSSVDVFLLDEIQFLADKKKSDEIFFYVFNELVNKRKQIVLTSDRQPNEIKGLENRLVSRFSSGLTVSVSAPEFETAVRIIKSKIDRQPISLDIEEKVVEYIAANYSSDVRKLEGTLNRLIFNLICSQENERIDLPFALKVLKDNNHNNKVITIKTLKNAVNEYYGLSKGQLEGKSRIAKLVQARHIAMHLCRKHLDLTYDAIGDAFGKRDHSTVMNACERIEKLIKTEKTYKTAVDQVEELFLDIS